ncbi:MAG: hypothetical protein PF795_14205 [Kiritimatiellae bacterium]|jgi:hypothetical protein|nr:hypothetical protein [Kiritimatiellia bacterium]
MASMNNNQRAEYYAKRLKESENLEQTRLEILREINSLQWKATEKPLTREERLEIVRLLEEKLFGPTKFGKLVEAADNSGILDVIDNLKNNVKGS